MDSARIADLLRPFLGPENGYRLATPFLQNISAYIDILLRWNARINLTAIREPEQIVIRHFGESLFAARCLFPAEPDMEPISGSAEVCRMDSAKEVKGEPQNRDPVEGKDGGSDAVDLANQQPSTRYRPTVADLGSGAGFPGLPIRLWAPRISLTLIEASPKKSAFLREVIRTLQLRDVQVQTNRAERLQGISFDLVTLRAVERFESILPIAAHLVAPGGRLALLIGSSQIDHAHSTLPQFTWSGPEPMPATRSRILAIGQRPK
jgi:16S rRNA (guanine527-N7)-methyltransferase